MKRPLILLGLILVSLSALAGPKIKIACIGNSITYGAGIANRDDNSYPAQLQQYLGDTYEVRNFGVNGRTLLHKGDLPYIQTREYKASLDYQPDIVLIKLGTNDSKPQNRSYLASDYLNDYKALLQSYDNLPGKPWIVLMSPVTCFTDDNISDQVIGTQIVPLVRQLAQEQHRAVINLYNLFSRPWEDYLMPDRIHPSSIGAGRVAQTIGQYIENNYRKTPATYPQALPAPTDTSNFNGYPQYNFTLPGGKSGESVQCHLVLPQASAPGQPWVLRARFWGHEPQTDIALLEHGIAIAYCDVANLYGSPDAVKRWDKFYSLMTRAGFNKKVTLEGMSRGGLPVYNWAAKHPERVLCIYADAPVMDLKSWPAKSSPDDTRQMMQTYGFKTEKQLDAWKKNPIDHAIALARTNIPILHVVGDADDVVPVAENTAVFRERYTAAGGTRMHVIHKPGVGHHPHSLSCPAPIVDFVLQAAGLAKNPCVRPIPGNEYRSAAGWAGGAEWHAVARDITATIEKQAAELGPDKRLKLLLLGNSITQGFGGCRSLVTYKPGRAAMDAMIGDSLLWASAGISGDRTQHLLWRIQHGNYETARPENVAITIGVNNINGGDRPEDVAEGILLIAREAAQRYAGARIILFGLLPAGADNSDPLRVKSDAIHAILLSRQAELPQGVEYVNPTLWFTDAANNGTLLPGLYSGDGIHLTGDGYSVWSGHIGQLIGQ